MWNPYEPKKFRIGPEAPLPLLERSRFLFGILESFLSLLWWLEPFIRRSKTYRRSITFISILIECPFKDCNTWFLHTFINRKCVPKYGIWQWRCWFWSSINFVCRRSTLNMKLLIISCIKGSACVQNGRAKINFLSQLINTFANESMMLSKTGNGERRGSVHRN